MGSQTENMENDAGGAEEEEDEETLQLKLQEIQARLRLKKLQRDKSKTQLTRADDGAPAGPQRALPAPTTQLLRDKPRPASVLDRPSSSQPTVIPASPVRRAKPPETQTSPSRVLLGIDKGRKAKDMSLKRAPGLRKRDGQPSPSGSRYLASSINPTSSSQSSTEPPRPRSFNERLAAARTEEEEKRERQEKIRRMRSNAFGISKDEMEELKTSAVEIPSVELRPPEFSREDILQGRSQPAPQGGRQRSNTTSSIPTFTSGLSNPNTSENRPSTGGAESESSSFESYSSFHLSRRIMPHGTLARQLRCKKVLGIKDLLRQVKAPEYELPDIEEDIVVFGIVASKSEPRAHKPPETGTQAPDRTKYMVVTIVDLEWELELFLFNSGFTRFWKIPEGTVVAILNPTIMPPPRAKVHSGKFSLVINSDADTIIEVGVARDLGFCKSMKKDGQVCNSWVNKKRTEFCEFHTNEVVRKTRQGRNELNQIGFGGEYRRNKPFVKKAKADDGKPKQGGTYDRETGTHWFATKSMSSAALIDGVADRKEREEALKRRVIAREKEQQMIKALSKVGSGTGQEYMRSAGTKPTISSSSSAASSGPAPQGPSQQAKQPDARELGLVGVRGKPTVSLSPVKRKRPDSSQSLASTESGGGGLGWGGGLRDRLSRMRAGENLAPRREARSPVKKKTRFITAKGIREAGRESLGEELTRGVDLDDDDELVILR